MTANVDKSGKSQDVNNVSNVTNAAAEPQERAIDLVGKAQVNQPVVPPFVDKKSQG